jgi:hypothetical protein
MLEKFDCSVYTPEHLLYRNTKYALYYALCFISNNQ